jgi:hypothetical protein
VKTREEKIAHTEALFRDVNERIAETAERFDAERADFVCECGNQACTARVSATLDEYEEIRSDATHFLLRPGHEDDRLERVLEQHGRRLAIVEKFHERVAPIVRRLDPRAQPA